MRAAVLLCLFLAGFARADDPNDQTLDSKIELAVLRMRYAADLQERLLDARVELEVLRTRFPETSPRITEAEAQIGALMKSAPAITPAEYLLIVQHRRIGLEVQQASDGLRYGNQHPKMIELQEKLGFLLKEERAAAKTAGTAPTPSSVR